MGSGFSRKFCPVLKIEGNCGLQKNLADSYRKVGHAGNMSDVAWQASSHNLVETSSYQRNSVVFVVRMALKAGLLQMEAELCRFRKEDLPHLTTCYDRNESVDLQT